MDFGTRLLAWLRAQGMTQKELAARIGVSPGAVTAWIKNTASPTHKNLDAIFEALRISAAKFYGRVPSGALNSAKKSLAKYAKAAA